MKNFVPQNIRNIYHLFQAILANLAYGFPSRNIKIIGVTGTNGKTTTCQMIARILEEAGSKVAMATTINFKIGEKEWVNATKFTTLSSFAVQKFISQAVESGCKYLILETSSHSLDQNRVWGVKYETAVITNITREHLDYHKNMEKYRQAKMKLYNEVNTVVVNLDMERPEDFISCKSKLKFGFTTSCSNKIQNPNGQINVIKSEDIKLTIDGSSFKIQDAIFKLNIPGLFNVENALAAICVGISEKLNLEICSKAFEKIKGIPGRMEYLPNDRNINIIIDYAVTPDSLEKLYRLINDIRSDSFGISLNSRIISVFGACGERDRGKRPMMSEIVSRFADVIILTNEDPYHEDPWRIINELAVGVKNKKENENLWKIMDRREAIRKALKLAQPGDYIIVTGKGAEETMAIGDERIPWNDRKVVLEELDNA
jgi:UDP-N-acetylmuramoyl-L-alanyl-D-glutamate--2,6-diaminopimelate ligase